jgi:hypothetical protein
MKPYIPVSFLLSLLLLQMAQAQTQSAKPFKVAMERMLWHDNIDKQQKHLIAPNTSKSTIDESVNLQINDALQRRIDELQQRIETDSTLSGQGKIKYLRSLGYILQGYNDNRNKKDFSAAMAPDLVAAFEQCMTADRHNQSFLPVIEASDYGVAKIVVDVWMRYSPDNPGMAGARLALIRKYCGLHPDEILNELRKNLDVPFSDSLIKVAAYRDMRKVYDYAQSRTQLAYRIRNHPDSLVKLIGRMANSKSGQIYFPFLDNLMRGKITFEEIDSVKDNDLGYFRLMVKTRLEYARRMLPPISDTASEVKALTAMMARKARQYFIREINALHSATDDNVRFRRLEGLTPQELYYLSVLGEDEIYTSSYTRGVYPRIFQRMRNPRGDSLLMSVHGDYFRKFIKMAAGYNTLNNFLGTMDKQNAETLMKAFVIGLEREKKTDNKDDDNLEDAVDVADSYSSIMDKNHELADFILNEVKACYTRNVQDNNKRGIVIYNLLRILFESADTTKKIDLSALLGIPSIYGQDYRSLTDDSGRVVQQVFFYGDEDKDGQLSFVNFMSMFRGRPEWKIEERNAEWVTITSTKGKPVWIFANRPLYGEDDPDEKAQNKLKDYLDSRKLKPTVVVHRGHSYHLPSTLGKLPSSAHIVVLGSCGGYNNLNEVLTICKDAHIISSKQVGTKTVNEPILQAINANLVAGKNIDWISMWKELGTKFTSGDAKEKFDDYIPPYKNLGAIFIKSYRNAMGRE